MNPTDNPQDSTHDEWSLPTPDDPSQPASTQDKPIVFDSARPAPRTVRRVIGTIRRDQMLEPLKERGGSSQSSPIPWEINQYLDGSIRLDEEMALRFPNLPLMSVFSVRDTMNPQEHGTAILSTQDGAAQVILDIDGHSGNLQVNFGFGSMLSLRFRFDDLSEADRTRWLQDLTHEGDRPGFLWGASRWQKDYMISIVRKYYTSIFAFSAYNFEAAIRMTPDVAERFRLWLAEYWGRISTTNLLE